MNASPVTRAYGASRGALDPRRLEADIFLRVTGALRAALGADGPRLARAVADNRRLWLIVEGAVFDPRNSLPSDLRAAIVSLGRAVMREMDAPAPDVGFLIEVNEQLAAGLVDQGRG
jgi:flagellar biosynthesis regulator FlaF